MTEINEDIKSIYCLLAIRSVKSGIFQCQQGHAFRTYSTVCSGKTLAKFVSKTSFIQKDIGLISEINMWVIFFNGQNILYVNC